MRIVVLTPGGVDRSGVDRVIPCLVWLIERLARRHDVQVIAYSQEPEPAQWDLMGARVHNLGTRRGRRLRLFATFGAIHRAHPVDAIFALFGWQGADAAMLGARWGVPVVFHAAGGEFVDLRAIRYGMRTSMRGRLALRIAAAGASTVTVSTRFMQSQAAARGIAAALLPLGVALDRWPPGAPRPRDPGATARLLHVADIRAVKGQEVLIDAAARLRDAGVRFELDVVGRDGTAGAMRRLAERRGLGARVRWRGLLRREPLRALFDSADALLLPSLHDAAPVVVLEAAVAGVPTVGSAVGWVADWAPDAAVATPVGDGEALARETAALLADDARRVAIAREAQRRALEFDADYTAAVLERMLEEARRVRRHEASALASGAVAR